MTVSVEFSHQSRARERAGPQPDGRGSVVFVAVHPATESQGESDHTVRKCGGGCEEDVAAKKIEMLLLRRLDLFDHDGL
jgi:hypothetical protein